MCVDICIDMCADICIDMYSHVHGHLRTFIYMCTGICTSVCIDIGAEICMGTCMGMCIDMCIGVCIGMHVDMCIHICFMCTYLRPKRVYSMHRSLHWPRLLLDRLDEALHQSTAAPAGMTAVSGQPRQSPLCCTDHFTLAPAVPCGTAALTCTVA